MAKGAAGLARFVPETGWRFTMRRFFDWHTRLAGDRRVVALGEDDRDGALWVIAHCRSGSAADSLFDSLWAQGWRTLGRHSHDSLWLECSEEPDAPEGPAPLDFDGLDDLVG